MIQPNIRGGLCHASVRYARANNKFIGLLTIDQALVIHSLRKREQPVRLGLFQPLPDNEYEWVSSDDCRDAMVAFQDESFSRSVV